MPNNLLFFLLVYIVVLCPMHQPHQANFLDVKKYLTIQNNSDSDSKPLTISYPHS